MTIYYHVSCDLDHAGLFIPRIPKDRGTDENESIKRVCVSTSIEGALTAIPGGSSDLDTLMTTQRGYLKIFKIDTDALCISKENIISTQALFEQGFVHDAELTGEVWITSAFAVPQGDQNIVVVQDWQEAVCDVIPHAIYELAENDTYQGDYLTCYMDHVAPRVPSSIFIYDLNIERVTLNNEYKLLLPYEDNEGVQELSDLIHAYQLPLVVSYIKPYYVMATDPLSCTDLTQILIEKHLFSTK